MRVEPMEIYVLDRFRRSGRVALRLSDIIDGCTATRQNALRDALVDMADRQHLIKRKPRKDGDIVELTEEGKQVVSLASADMRDHIERRR